MLATANLPNNGTVLALDFGERRIGVAVGDWFLKIAHPLATILVPTPEKSEPSLSSLIQPLIQEWQPTQLIVGLPSYKDGTEHRISALCRAFAEDLKQCFALPVFLVDERFTSREADQQLLALQVKSHSKKHKELRDQVAAQLILQQYFDQNNHAAQP